MSENKIWLIWDDEKRSPFVNMAIDELLLEQAAQWQTVIVRVYGWDRPAVSIGYVQTYSAAPLEGYTIVRRPTGGGVVFHDVDLTYTIIVPSCHPICELDRMESYNVFHRAVLKAAEKLGIEGQLAQEDMPPVDRATMQCFVTPTRYDVLHDSRKIAGSAQRRTKNGILHQGSIVLNNIAEGMRVKNELITAFQNAFEIEFNDFHPPAELLEDAEKLAQSKYATEEWNKKK